MNAWTESDVVALLEWVEALYSMSGALLIGLYVVAGVMILNLGYKLASDFGISRTGWINTRP